jgi:hypothetical protein
LADYTNAAPKEVQLPARLPLIGIPNQRAASPADDSRLINGYVEMGEDNELRVVKRPGLTLRHTLSGYGVGMLGNVSIFYAPVEGGYSGKFYFDNSLIGTIAAYADVSVPPSRWFTLHPVAFGIGDSVTFFHNKYAAFTYNGAVIKSVPMSGDALSLTCGITNTFATVTTADTSGLTVYSSVTGTGISPGTFVESIDSATGFTMSAPATATNATAALTFSLAGPGTQPADVVLTGGVADLNGSTYVFTTASQVQGSDAFTPYAWNPLNFIFAYASQDNAMAITKQLSYIIAFKSESIEFFRDAGLSPGSPLERLEGMRLDVGCWEARTVQSIDGTVLWASYTESGLKSVWTLQGLKAQEIATPAVRRVLEGMEPTYAVSISIVGHSFYILTDPVAGISLVYDLASKFWSYWSALGETYFPFVAVSVVPSPSRPGIDTLLQHEDNGKIYVFDEAAFTDDGTPITMEVFPPQYDAGMRVVKYLNRMYVIADQRSAGTLEVRINDNDQASGEWSAWRPFDLTHPRPAIYNCGTFSKRWFHFRHSSATQCRLQAVELDLMPGTI